MNSRRPFSGERTLGFTHHHSQMVLVASSIGMQKTVETESRNRQETPVGAALQRTLEARGITVSL